MAKNSEYRMAIKIAGEIEQSLYNCTDLTRKELNKIAREAAYTSTRTKSTFSQGLKETEPLFEGIEKAGVKAFKAVAAAAAAAGTAVIGIGTMAANEGIEFESAFAGVKKTTTATAREYAQIREEIIAMTREIPAAGAEIAEVAEAAGQLGIEKENLLGFSRVMIDLGESTDLASTEAASALAKFANITNPDMMADDYSRLGSVIVDLGNNFATTESDIVSMATRLASAGELAGFTQAQIMAMATAMSSVGIEAEAGGSSMSKIIKNIQVAVETNSESLKDYASVAGKSVEDFRKDFQDDALSAVAAFIGGLNDVERNGKSATVILDEMGLTEVRLSNTLLSLANADGLLLEAVTTANDAWDENIALSNEAAQRYETTESKIAIMKNGFTEMGIAMYDQFNEPLREGIDVVTDLVHQVTTDISNSNVIHDITQDIVNGIPTAMRLLANTTDAIGDFAEPFLAVGGWMVDHPQVITGTITGIGSALGTYKIAKGIQSVSAALTGFTAASLPVLGLTAAAGVIIGIGVAVKTAEEKAKKANLAEHFGKITLSMQEMEDVAAYILSNDSFGQLNEAISELGELDGIQNSIENTVSRLNKMNWKVSLGMELEEGEQEQYKQDIASYISDVQSYLEQEQYAINLSVGVLTGEDLEESNIVTQLNEFYAGKSTELAAIGKELNDYVTEAFQDGLLDIDEAKTIAELQQQMADVKASLAMGSYEASLDLLGMKYAGGQLDAESYQNLLSEISKQGEEARQMYDEAYMAANQAYRAMLADGGIEQGEYDAVMKELQEDYLAQVSEIDIKGADFAVNTIMQQYSSEIGDKAEINSAVIDELIGTKILPYSETGYDSISLWNAMEGARNVDIEQLTGAYGDALSELWDLTEPLYQKIMEDVSSYTTSGQQIPEELKEAMNNATSLGMIAGDYDAFDNAMGMAVYDNADYQDKINEMMAEGASIPEQISRFMLENTESIDNAAGELWDHTNQQLQDEFSREMEVEAKINVKLAARTASAQIGAAAIANNADGGIITSPTISWLAEGGYPESVIPLDGSRNAVSLWQQTGEMLGVLDRKDGYHALAEQLLGDSESSITNTVDNSEETNKFSYSPTYNFYGEAPSKKDLDEHIEDSFEKWEEMMERWISNNRRYSFR